MSETDGGEPDVAQLEARIDALEEQYNDETVSDSNGNRISLGGLLNSGLSRRQALKTMALVVSGATLTGAMTQSVAAQNAITGIDQLGEETNRIGTIYAQDINTDVFTQTTESIVTNSLTTDALNDADISDTATAERTLETDGNGNLEPVAAVTDGDGTKREVWVIANGASDPAGADAEDLILEEES